MKLLKNERAYFRWMRTEISSANEDAASLRSRGPSAYPCYAYEDSWDDYHERTTMAFLYSADIEIMAAELFFAEPKRPAVIRSWGT